MESAETVLSSLCMNAWRDLVRCTALIVLINLALGVCACLADPVLPESAAAILSPDDAAGNVPVCGTNCESCICCAATIVSAWQFHQIETVLSRITAPAVVTFASADPLLNDRPPRA